MSDYIKTIKVSELQAGDIICSKTYFGVKSSRKRELNVTRVVEIPSSKILVWYFTEIGVDSIVFNTDDEIDILDKSFKNMFCTKTAELLETEKLESLINKPEGSDNFMEAVKAELAKRQKSGVFLRKNS